jgi:GT2 family glycosyltransferase
MTSIAIILLNYNSSDETIECIESLEKITTKNAKLSLIVVDNHSSENEIKKLNKFFKTHSSRFVIEIIQNTKNLGYTGGNNSGITKALEMDSEYVLILNNDTTVMSDFLDPLLDVLKNDTTVGIVVPKIYFYPGHEFHTDRYTKKDHGKVIWYAGGEIDWANVIGHHTGVDEVDTDKYTITRETEYATGACVMLKASTLREVGNFDDQYFLYYEDSDLSMRVKRAGYKILFVPQSIIWHKNAGSTGGSGSQLQDYFISRNRMRFGMKYAPLRTKIALTRESIRILFTGRKWQKNGIKDFYTGKFGKGSYPVSE